MKSRIYGLPGCGHRNAVIPVLLDGALDALFDYYEIRSQFREGRHLLQTAFDTVDTSAVDTDAFAVRLEARLGWLSFHAGDVADGTARGKHALDKARSAELQRRNRVCNLTIWAPLRVCKLGSTSKHCYTRLWRWHARRATSLEQASRSTISARLHCSVAIRKRRTQPKVGYAKGDWRPPWEAHFLISIAQIDAALGDYDAALRRLRQPPTYYAALHDQRTGADTAQFGRHLYRLATLRLQLQLMRAPPVCLTRWLCRRSRAGAQ